MAFNEGSVTRGETGLPQGKAGAFTAHALSNTFGGGGLPPEPLEMDMDDGMSRATIEDMEDGTWSCEVVWREPEVGEVISEESTTHSSREAAVAHAEHLRDTTPPYDESDDARAYGPDSYKSSTLDDLFERGDEARMARLGQ